MTADQLRARFPNASETFLRQNAVDAAGPNHPAPSPAPVGAAKPRVRQSAAPRLNRLETEFARHLAETYPQAAVYAQSLKFRLANGTTYLPDFVSFDGPRPRCWECKGPFAYAGSLEKLKIAAGLYPQIEWTLAWREKGRPGWQSQTILP
jgi:hypothetical protein